MQGKKDPINSSSCRTACQELIRLLRTEDHGWYISMMKDDHNHPLSESYAENKQWKSHNQIDAITIDFIRKLRANNVSISRVCSILGVGSNTPQAPLRKETVRSVCAKIAQENMREDLGKTMQILEDMRARDNELSVKFKIDSEGKLTSMLWWTGKNKEDYKRFGDAITFDTTYGTNLQAPFFVCMWE